MTRLVSRGWRGVRRAQQHTSSSAKILDAKEVARKVAYFQMLLVLPDVLRKGYAQIDNDQSQSLDRVVLLKPGPAAPELRDKAYKQMLAESGCDVGQDPLHKRLALRRFAAASRRWLLNDATTTEPGDFADIVGDSPDLGGPELEPDAGGGPLGRPDGARNWLRERRAEREYISGVRVRVVAANPSEGYGYRERLSVGCPNPGHRCSKSRSVRLHVDRCGPRATELYLRAWLRKSDLPEAAHKAFVPSAADIAAYKAAHPDPA